MTNSNFKIVQIDHIQKKKKAPIYLQTAIAVLLLFLIIAASNFGQTPAKEASATPFRIGERLTYNVSFDRYPNAGYGETYVVSRGRLGDKDVVELRSRVKTVDLLSAVLYFVDESRTTFVSAETGLPVYSRKTENTLGLPKDTIKNHLTDPTTNFDLLSLLFKIRHSGGNGSATMAEGDRVYTFSFQSGASEQIKNDAGDFATNILTVQSDYFDELGLADVRINLTNDEAKIPVLIRFKKGKGEFRVAISGISIIEPDVPPVIQPVPTPRPSVTPKPPATPEPYVDNQPLAAELAFELGETIEFQVTSNGKNTAKILFHAKERKQFQGADSLLLDATITEADPGFQGLMTNDFVRTQVDPLTLAPRQVEVKFSGMLSEFNQIATFDSKTNAITYGGTNRLEAPVGTHSILSLLYAMRSFNLKPSRDLSSPVNDTRVAVFWGNQPYVFTLRPSASVEIPVGDLKLPAQLINVTTGNQELDQLGIKVWLGNDVRRTPLRFTLGSYQFDLVTSGSTPPK